MSFYNNDGSRGDVQRPVAVAARDANRKRLFRQWLQDATKIGTADVDVVVVVIALDDCHHGHRERNPIDNYHHSAVICCRTTWMMMKTMERRR